MRANFFCTDRVGLPMHSVRGFTLIELMMVVLILGVLASLAAPSFSRLVASNNVRSAASDLQLALLRARSEAISRNVSVVVSRSAAGWQNGWSVRQVDPDTLIDDFKGVNGLVADTTPASITFTFSGRADALATIEFKSEKYPAEVRCVTIEPSGRPSVTKAGC